MKKIIITATAESIEQVQALLEAGVDRIYVGEEKYGLRLPHNFTYDELNRISQMVHQAGKIQDKAERKKFLDWLWDFEFNLYGLPVPAEVFFLNMPPEYSAKLMKNRENKITHEAKKDIHEKDQVYLTQAYNAACELSKEYNWYEIKCVKDGKIRTIQDINDEIFTEVKKHI